MQFLVGFASARKQVEQSRGYELAEGAEGNGRCVPLAEQGFLLVERLKVRVCVVAFVFSLHLVKKAGVSERAFSSFFLSYAP